MKEKKVLRFVPQDKNMTNMVEIEDFLVKNLKQDNLNENDL